VDSVTTGPIGSDIIVFHHLEWHHISREDFATDPDGRTVKELTMAEMCNRSAAEM